MAGLEGVRVGRSLISAPQSRALHLDPALAEGPREAFILGTEFAHLHGRHDGSLHLALPRALVKDALEHGWAEPHPATRSGDWPSTLMMLYGPRDRDELELVWRLVQASYAFARGRDA